MGLKLILKNSTNLLACSTEAGVCLFGNKFKNILSEAVTKINCAGHLVVLKTYAGTAQAAAVAIDALEVPTLIGCVAGDDTIIIVMATENDARDFMKKLSKSIKG